MQRSSLSTSSLNIGLSIGHKLFFAFTGLALVLTLGMGGMFAGHLYRSFNHYLAQAELGRLGRMVGYLELRHEREGGWGFARTPQDLFPKRPALPPTLEGNPSVPPPPPSAALSNRPADPQGIEDRIALFDAEQKWLLGAPAAKGRPLRPLYSGNRVVIGYIGLAPALTQTPPPPREAGRPPPPGGQGPAPLSLEDHFLRNQLWYLLWVLLAGFLLSASMAFLIARSARRRVAAVSTVLHAITEGNLEARTDTPSEKSRGQDELDQLATDTNRMAVKLQEIEVARQRWVADTSHELRTPLTILRLHLDGLQDGVIAPSKENFAPILAAVQDLEGLVKDLQTLAMGDAMGKTVQLESQFHPTPILALLESLALQYRAAFTAQGLELHILPDATTLAAQPQSCVWGDELRLRQLFTNLLSNTLRYTDAGGRAELRIRADLKHHRLLFELHDSAPSVPEDSLPRLFERFYRVDASRSRASGGSGLGLAIVRSIVQTHGGKVSSTHSDLGGLCIQFDLPLATSSNLNANLNVQDRIQPIQ